MYKQNMDPLVFLTVFLQLSPFIIVSFFTLSSIFNSEIRGLIYLVCLLVTVGIAYGLNMYGLTFINKDSMPVSTPAHCGTLEIFKGTNFSIGQVILTFTFTYLLTNLILNDIREPDSHFVSNNWPTITFFSIILFTDLILNVKTDFFGYPFIGILILCISILLIFFKQIFGITLVHKLGIGEIFGYIFLVVSVLTILSYIGKGKEPGTYCYNLRQTSFSYLVGIVFGFLSGWLITHIFNNDELKYFPINTNKDKCKKATNKKYKCRKITK